MTYLFFVIILILIFKSELVHSGSAQTIQKCCPKNYTVIIDIKTKQPSCFSHINENNFSEVRVYNENLEYTRKMLPEMFNTTIYQNFDKKILQKDVTIEKFYFKKNKKLRSYLLDDGRLTTICDTNEKFCYFSNHIFCLEYRLFSKNNIMVPMIFALDTRKITRETITTSGKLKIAAMFLSSFFLLLVVAVYAMLRELRTLGGLMVMATVISLMMTFILLGFLTIFNYNGLMNPDVCKGFIFTIYFFFLAFFFWSNIMSFDIWWTFRGFATTIPMHRPGRRFLMYSIYALGIPALMTSVVAILNEITSWINPLKEGSCAVDASQRTYPLSVPMLILLTANFMFFIMTACSIRKLQSGDAMLGQRGKNKQRLLKLRFFVYVKLSLVMGISWVLDAVSSLVPNFQAFYISEAFNCLMGLFIFIIFVCKPKIWKQLRNRFAIPVTSSPDRRSSRPRFFSNRGSSTDSTDSEYEHSERPVVCLDPRGNDKRSNNSI